MNPEQKTTEPTANSVLSVPPTCFCSKGSKLLSFTAVVEAVTGLALMVAPEVVVRLLLGAELSGAGIPMSRVAGIALFALGMGCWPNRDPGSGPAGALRAMLGYNLLATLYLAYLGICGAWGGFLLWPAVALHAVVTPLLAGAWFKNRQTLGTKP